MAKIYLKKLQEKYKFKEGDVRGLNYRKLMRDIISNQTENISKATLRISAKNYDDQMVKLLKTKKIEQKMSLPNIEEVLPKKSVFARKGAIDGNIMTDTLRNKMTKNLRDTLDEFKTKGGEPSYIKLKGEEKGQINPKVIKKFEQKIKGTFNNYTKAHPDTGIPTNIHTIAVTEIRSTLNPIKHNYNMKLYEKNKDMVDMFKEWRQNKNLSFEPRPGHSKVNGKRVKIDQKFKVPNMIKIKGKWRNIGIDLMDFPHDPTAEAGQVIGCNCDTIYFMSYKTSKKKT